MEAKLTPFTVITKLPVPTTRETGEMLPNVGTGLLPVPVTVKVCEPEVPPPGPGFATVMLRLAGLARSDAKMVALNWLDEENVVERAEPLTFTTEEGIKLFPFTVNVNAPLPDVITDEEREVVTGTMLPTVNVWALEVPPPVPGLVTVTLKFPVEVKSEAGTEAVNWLGET